MQHATKISIACAFAVAAYAGVSFWARGDSPAVPEQIICTAEGLKVLNPDGSLSLKAVPSSVSVDDALRMASMGKISFGDGGATVHVIDDKGVETGIAYLFLKGGKICKQDEFRCMNMSVLTPAQKADLVTTLCKRAGDHGIEDFRREFCTPAP